MDKNKKSCYELLCSQKILSLPIPLQEIIQQIMARDEKYVPNTEQRRQLWEEHLQNIQVTDAGSKNTDTDQKSFLRIEDGGESIFTGSLSTGCRMCKQGAWDCIFMTMDCNLSCGFCCSPGRGGADQPFSAFGTDPVEIAKHYEQVGIKGIAFTGGEPFLVFDTLIEWLCFFRKKFPGAYLWLYTNGTMASAEKIAKLGSCGLNEIRFNMAATDYTNEKILPLLKISATKIGRVTVEIPCISSHKDRVIAALPLWGDAGVTHLNLHELMKEPGSPSARLEGDFMTLVLEDGHRTLIENQSRAAILEIIYAARQKAPNLSVNECSIQGKLGQIRGRRRNMARVLKKSFERLCDDGCLESCFSWRSESDFLFSKSFEEAPKGQEEAPWHHIKLKRRPPLTLVGDSDWITFTGGDFS